jgi:hypothetical protein
MKPAALPFCLLLLLLLAACDLLPPARPVVSPSPDSQAGGPTNPASRPAEFSTATPGPPPATPTVTPVPPDFSQYSLEATLDYDRHHLTVVEQITYVNGSSEALPELLLLVPPNLYPNVFRLSQLAWADGQPIEQYSLQGQELRLPLTEALPPGKRAALALTYELNLPQQAEPFGFTERQANLSDWYAFIPPYRPGAGWVAHPDAYLGESLVYETVDFQVALRLAQLASAAGLPLTVAASAPAQPDGEWTRFRLPAARTFAWSVSDQYQVNTLNVDGVTLLGYSFPYHPAADQPALQAAADALRLYSELYGPYPYQSLSVVEGDFLNGMEFDGLFFLSHAFYDFFTGTPQNNLIIIAAHETAHQWWFAQVGNDQALEPWLDEALTTYSERLFYERYYPDQVDWYWEARITFHQPQGWVNSTIYEASGFHPYRDAVYLRGAQFLHELRTQMGDEAFLSFLRDYLARYTYQIASAADFFAVLKEHTAADISGLVAQYFK